MNKPPFLSFVCLFSRPETVTQWISYVEKLKLPRFATEVVFLLDTKSPEDYKPLFEHFKERDWHTVRIVHTDNEPCSAVNVMERRARITENMNRLRGMVGKSQFVFGLEDDTFPTPHAFERLYQTITHRQVAFVSGVEVGRWNLPYIGAWKADRVVGTNELRSLPYRDDHIQEIDAAGLYCYITRGRHFRYARFTDTKFGPDINYTLSLRRSGNRLYVDWSVKCGHLAEKTNRILVPNENCAQVSLIREGDFFRVESHVPFVQQ